jgi:hypothetical protein
MLKDPNHQDETPYELLGVALEASPGSVHQALPRFMRDRRNIPRLGRAQEAVKKLKNARERAEIDIWFYEIEAVDPAAASDGQLDLAEFRRVPSWGPEAVETELDSPGPSPAAEIAYLNPRISDLKRFDGWDARGLRPPLDR